VWAASSRWTRRWFPGELPGLPDTSRPEDTPTMNSESGHLEEPGPHASRARPHGMRSSSSTAQSALSVNSTGSPHSARPRPRPIRRASGSRKKWGRTPTARPLAAQSGYPRALSTQIQADAAIQERAEGRARVPQKFSDGCKVFFFSATGLLKILRLVSRELMT
jgi:hypothetical protein